MVLIVRTLPGKVQLGQGQGRPRVAVVGCGGAGCNTLRHVPLTPNLEIIGLNDVPHPSMVGIKHRILIHDNELRMVATLDDDVAKNIATDAEKVLAREFKGFDVVVAIAGLGGSTGGDGANAVMRVAKLHNMTNWAIVTIPFKAEGMRRREASRESRDLLHRRVPAMLTFANDRLLDIAPNIPIARAFSVMGQIMIKPLEALLKVLTSEDLQNVRNWFYGCREMRLGIGEAEGRNKSFTAVDEALSSPWIDYKIEDTRRAIVLMSGAELDEKLTDDVLHCINLKLPLAEILWGSYTEGEGEKIRVSIMIPTP